MQRLYQRLVNTSLRLQGLCVACERFEAMKALLFHLSIAVVLGAGLLSCQMTTNNESRAAGAEDVSPTTGLEGRTMIAAPCPGPVVDDKPCPDRPLSASFEVLDSQNKVVARFQSDAEGRFRIALQPGPYSIIPDATAPLFNPRSQVKQVTVKTDAMTEITLRFDSGMR